jgi:type II secretory pathway component PulK
MKRFWQFLIQPRGRKRHAFFMDRSVSKASQKTGKNRGIALLMVTMCLAFVASVGADIGLSGEVRMLKSVHQRDELLAEGLARSGLNMYRLVLVANKQLGDNSAMSQGAEMMGVNLGNALWQAIPNINTGLLRMFLVTDGDVDDDDLERLMTEGLSEEEIAESRAEGGSMFEDKGFLDFEGDFVAEVSDEDAKISVKGLGATSSASIMENPTAIQLFGLMSGEENDQWFYDRNIDRWDLISNLKDWIDTDTNRSGARGGYEDDLYNRLESPYLSKNAPFDTKSEMRLVEGWQDDVYERFGDKITIYGSGKINVATASDEVLKGLFKAYVSPSPSDFTCEQLLESMKEYNLLTAFRSGKEFVSWLESQGVSVDEDLSKVIGTVSTVFRVVSTGFVGETSRTITAIFDFSGSGEGDVLYWRLE